MIYPGTDLKFKVTAVGRGMTLADNDFTLVVKNSYGRVMLALEKQDMLTDSAGGFYFKMVNVPGGVYTAILTIAKTDINFDGARQHVVDYSPLCTVSGESVKMGGPSTDGLVVCYERIWTVNIGEGVYLCDVNGNPILDSDGKPIMLSEQGSESESVKLDITAAELNKLLTSHDKNGKIDTIPEVLDAIGNIGDVTEVSVMTDADTDDMMHRILGNGDTAGGH